MAVSSSQYIFLVTLLVLFRSLSELFHFCKIMQPLLPTLTPQLKPRLIKVCPTITLSGERSNSDDNSSVLKRINDEV
jgi:hypothetical protein